LSALSSCSQVTIGHSTEDCSNKHCTHHSYCAGVNHFDLLLRSGLTRRWPSDVIGENEIIIIIIVKAISKDINMNFGLEKCGRICLKESRVQSKIYIGRTFEKDIKVLRPEKSM
jgi:hypothetical protein